ncbi:MAG TPA: tetratricopeptide repeat protein, partial [Terriglobales bacterium]|nr:tetratricopeptide repeat protein [Terriglobales bacterium]
EFLGLVIATDDMTIINDLSVAFEERKRSALVAMLGIETATQGRPVHSAAVTVNELAVPSKARKALEKAFYAVRKHNLQEARSKVRDVLAIWPRYSDALMLSALLSLHANELDAALEAAKEAVRGDVTNGMAYIILALVHNSRGEYDDALGLLEPALRFRPDAWEGYFERASAEIAKREFSAALSDVTRAGELAPPNAARIHFVKGVALINLNRRAEGTSELQEYLRRTPIGATAEKAHLMLEQAHRSK